MSPSPPEHISTIYNINPPRATLILISKKKKKSTKNFGNCNLGMFTIILTPFSSNIVTTFLCARRLSRPMLIILLISSYYILYTTFYTKRYQHILGVFFFRYVSWLDFTYLPTLIKCTFTRYEHPVRKPLVTLCEPVLHFILCLVDQNLGALFFFFFFFFSFFFSIDAWFRDMGLFIVDCVFFGDTWWNVVECEVSRDFSFLFLFLGGARNTW